MRQLHSRGGLCRQQQNEGGLGWQAGGAQTASRSHNGTPGPSARWLARQRSHSVQRTADIEPQPTCLRARRQQQGCQRRAVHTRASANPSAPAIVQASQTSYASPPSVQQLRGGGVQGWSTQHDQSGTRSVEKQQEQPQRSSRSNHAAAAATLPPRAPASRRSSTQTPAAFLALQQQGSLPCNLHVNFHVMVEWVDGALQRLQLQARHCGHRGSTGRRGSSATEVRGATSRAVPAASR